MKRVVLCMGLVVLLAACSQQGAPTPAIQSQVVSSWTPLGDPVLGSAVKLVVNAKDRPVRAFNATDIAGTTQTYVQEWNGTTWQTLGVFGGNVYRPALATRVKQAPGSPFYDPLGLAYVQRDANNNDNLYVKVRSGQNWLDLGVVDDSVFYTSLVLDKLGFPVVSYLKFDDGIKFFVKRWTGKTWLQLGSNVGSNGGLNNRPSLAIDENNTPYVAFSSGEDANRIIVRRWNGRVWVNVGTAVSSAEGEEPGIALSKTGVPFVTWYESGSGSLDVRVRRWNGSSWINVGGILDVATDQGAIDPAIAVDAKGNPVVTWAESSSIETEGFNVYVKRWTGTRWELIGKVLDENANQDVFEPVVAIRNSDKAVVTWSQDVSGIIVKQEQ
jgi:hypothetical protein